MPGTQTLDRHAKLMGDMAQTVGADLDEAELRGALPPDLRDEMLLACTGCADPTACAAALAAGQIGDMPPDYCRNAGILAALAAE